MAHGKEVVESEGSDETPLDGEGGKSSKKKIILIVVPLLLLLGGGAGLYFTGTLDKILNKETSAEAGKEGEHGKEAAGDKKAEGEGDKKAEGEGEHGGEGAGPEVAFLKIPDLIVNLTSEGQPRYLRLSIQLELANEADMKAVEKVLPRVVDQFQTYLRELKVQDLRGSKGIYRLQMELLSRVNAAAAPTQVKDVLFQEILIQ
ncbi:MAG: flagellar basal body-associated FliL family protein [Alphaproteobacteria bacterium]|nr:flagellar basal body-associated FliL family protein [Alphaproteobacteria bacterium]